VHVTQHRIFSENFPVEQRFHERFAQSQQALARENAFNDPAFVDF
jgi:hypothetical protein